MSDCVICGKGFVGTCPHTSYDKTIQLTSDENNTLLRSMIDVTKLNKALESENTELKKLVGELIQPWMENEVCDDIYSDYETVMEVIEETELYKNFKSLSEVENENTN